MAAVTLSKDECRSKNLPQVCVVCGRAAGTYVYKKFRWIPPLALLGLLAGVLPFFVIVLIALRIRRTHLPYCEEHKAYWKRWRRLLWYGFIPVALGIAFSLVYDAFIAPPSERGGALSGLLCGGAFVLFALWLVYAAIVGQYFIRAVSITTLDIRLVGVHGDFVSALQEYRARIREQRRTERQQKELSKEGDRHPRNDRAPKGDSPDRGTGS